MSHEGNCYCPNCDRSFDRDGIEARLRAATERAEALQAELESHANQELAWKLQLNSIRERAERATELLRKNEYADIDLDSHSDTYQQRTCVECGWAKGQGHAKDCAIGTFVAILSPRGARTFESLVAAMGELPTTGLAAAEPPPEEPGLGIPDEQELMDRDGGDR